jgi:disulfide bond formation protein DsbB
VRIRIRAPQVLVAVALLAFGAVGAAVVAQYQFDMQPCVWCVLQRLIYLVVGVLALVGAFFDNRVRRGAVFLGLLVALSGIASALWQQFVAAKSESCDLTLAERIVTGLHLDRLVPDLFIAYASCADAAVNLIGVPFAIWSCALYVILSVLLFWTLRAGRGPRGSGLQT